MASATLIPATANATEAGGRMARAVSVGLGVVLLTAAGLKLYGLNVTPVPQVGWFSTPRVQVLTVAWELVLGLWLVSGSYRAGAWVAAVGTFAAFATVSGYFGWTGVANCGCLGVVRASPWAAFGVDVASLVLLAVSRPDLTRGALRIPAQFVTVGVGGAALLIGAIAIGSWIYGSPRQALAKLRGESFGVTPSYVDYGKRSVGDRVNAAVEIRNFSDHPLRLTGGSSDCSCVTTLDLPMTIPPGNGAVGSSGIEPGSLHSYRPSVVRRQRTTDDPVSARLYGSAMTRDIPGVGSWEYLPSEEDDT